MKRALLLGLLLLVPLALAVDPSTPDEILLFNQVGDPTTLGSGSATPGFPITTGEPRFFISGEAKGGGTTGWTLRDPSNNARCRITGNAILTQDIPGWACSLRKHENVSVSGTDAWYAVVYFTPTETGTGTQDIGNTPIYGWDLDGVAIGDLAGYVAHVTQTGQLSGVILDALAAPPSPGAPVLSGSIIEGRNVLTWTTAAGGVTGYNVTRTDIYGTYVAHLGAVNTFNEGATTRNRTYTVTAWGSGGDGSPSNAVTLQHPPVDLFGDEGAIFGGDKTALAAAVGVPETGLDLLMSLLLILVFAVGGLLLTPAHRLIGGSGGAVAGFFIVLANDLMPIWVLVFAIAIAAAAYLLIQRRGRSA